MVKTVGVTQLPGRLVLDCTYQINFASGMYMQIMLLDDQRSEQILITPQINILVLSHVSIPHRVLGRLSDTFKHVEGVFVSHCRRFS